VGQVKLVQEKITTAVKGVSDNEEINTILKTSRELFYIITMHEQTTEHKDNSM